MLIEDLLRNTMDGQQTDLILLDFSKAFDKVSHEKLLFKLHQYGIRHETLQWIKAFLSNRLQQVVVDNDKSDTVPVTSGVPQGSVLGPILFLIYINDLPDEVRSKVRLFADDTAVYLAVTNLNDAQQLQQDLDKLQLWEDRWDMEFNPSKCTVIQVTRSKKLIPSVYTLHGHILETVSSAKYLGVNLTNDLNWSNHVQQVSSSANRSLGFLKRNIRSKNPGIRQTAYKALVRPVLEYSSPVWSPHTQQNINKLEMTQRRAARWVHNDYSYQSSVTEMLNKLNWRSLEDRRSDARLCLFFKIIYGLVAIDMPTYIRHPSRISRHQHPLAFCQIQSRFDYYKYSFFPLAVIQWNSLPAYIATQTNLNSFKLVVSSVSHPIP